MPVRKRPLLGAFALAIFITACLGWLFQATGTPFNLWGYIAVLALCALLVGALAGLLRKNGNSNGNRHDSVRSIDSYKELE